MYNRFKDKRPEETIQIARTILNRWGVLVTERWYDSLGELCSLTLTIDGTDFCTHGKGIGKPYALASAYGEMMERLQNMAFFRLRGTASIMDNKDYGDNTYAVQEDNDFFIKNISVWLEMIGKVKFEDLFLDKIRKYSGENGHVRYYKFFQLNEEKILYIPEKIIDLYYGTNGMVAGNDFYEALVQGISEILERYVTMEILKGGITPPDITDYVKKVMPEAVDWIEDIEAGGVKKLEIKDLSLGKKIPAVGLLMYDLETATYFVKIAVHPKLEISVERCFTELMQGQKISEYYGMTSANLFQKKKLEAKNLSEILVYGSGKYPFQIFENKPSYKEDVSSLDYKSNKEMVKSLKEIVEKMGYKILINYAVYSQFPAYHIVIPGMSEIAKEDDDTIVERGIDYDKVCKIVQYSLKNITEEDAEFILKYVQKNGLSRNMRLKSLLYDVHVSDECIYGRTTIDLFMCLLYLKIKDYRMALKWLSVYNEKLEKANPNSKYYFCYELYLNLIAEGIERKRCITYMYKFYDQTIVEMVLNDFEQNPFEYFEPLICDKRCFHCLHQKYCITKKEKIIYEEIKKSYKGKEFKLDI